MTSGFVFHHPRCLLGTTVSDRSLLRACGRRIGPGGPPTVESSSTVPRRTTVPLVGGSGTDHARSFPRGGYRVRVSISARGREMTSGGHLIVDDSQKGGNSSASVLGAIAPVLLARSGPLSCWFRPGGCRLRQGPQALHPSLGLSLPDFVFVLFLCECLVATRRGRGYVTASP